MFDEAEKKDQSAVPVDMFKETDTEVPRISSTQAQSQAVVPRVAAAGEHLRPHRSFVSGKAALIAGAVVIVFALGGIGIQFMLANAKKQAAEPLIQETSPAPTTETVQEVAPPPDTSIDLSVPAIPEQVPAVAVDSDADGMPDDIEAVLGTDPANMDSDGDGYKDLEEIRNGYNPLGPDKMTDEQKTVLNQLTSEQKTSLGIQ